jgi:hypothetical protein
MGQSLVGCDKSPQIAHFTPAALKALARYGSIERSRSILAVSKTRMELALSDCQKAEPIPTPYNSEVLLESFQAYCQQA